MKRQGKPGRVAFLVLALAIGWYVAQRLVFAPRAADGGAAGSTQAKGYVLQFGEDFKSLLASRDDLGVSVVIAVDVSGSMASIPAAGGKPKYVQAAAALMRVVDVLERLSRDSPPGQVLKAGLLVFNEDVRPVMSLTELDGAGIAKLRALAEDPWNFKPDGSTAIGAALERSVEWLSQSGTILRSAIVVTDGENMTGPAPAAVLAAVRADRNSASTAEIPVATNSILVSFIGFDIDAGRFAAIEREGARVLAAADQAELAEVLSSVLEADIGRLEAPALGSGGVR
jgi:hypothetical protein